MILIPRRMASQNLVDWGCRVVDRSREGSKQKDG